jgi:hypothetical protein
VHEKGSGKIPVHAKTLSPVKPFIPVLPALHKEKTAGKGHSKPSQRLLKE